MVNGLDELRSMATRTETHQQPDRNMEPSGNRSAKMPCTYCDAVDEDALGSVSLPPDEAVPRRQTCLLEVVMMMMMMMFVAHKRS